MAEESKDIERIFVIPLSKTRHNQYSRAAPKAVKAVRSFLTRHMKVEEGKIWIDGPLNEALWAHGRYRIPSKIRVRAVKFEDGVVEASLPEFAVKKSRRELLKEEKAKKEPILKKGEKEEGEEAEPVEPAAGAEGYDITPTAEGDVKIKKKKEPKPKKEGSEETLEPPVETPAEEKVAEKKTKKIAVKTKKKPAAEKKTEKTETKTTKRKSPSKKKT